METRFCKKKEEPYFTLTFSPMIIKIPGRRNEATEDSNEIHRICMYVYTNRYIETLKKPQGLKDQFCG